MNKKKNTLSNRQYIYDYLRVFACLGVIGIHSQNILFSDTSYIGQCVAIFFELVFRIGLPIFFILSGVLLLNSNKKQSLINFYWNRFVKVIIPFIFYSLFYYCWINRDGHISSILDFSFVKGAITSIPSGILASLAKTQYYHLWFIYSIIGLYLAIPFLKVMLNNMSMKQLYEICIVLFVIRIIVNYLPYFKITITISEWIFSGWVMYLIFGYTLIQPQAKKYYNIIISTGIIAFIVSFVINRWFSQFKSVNVFDLAPLMILQVCAVFILFYKYEKYICKFMSINKIISYFSTYTFSIYMLHAWVLSKVGVRIFRLTFLSRHLILETFLVIFCTFIVSFVFAFIFDNIFVKWIQKLFIQTSKTIVKTIDTKSVSN